MRFRRNSTGAGIAVIAAAVLALSACGSTDDLDGDGGGGGGDNQSEEYQLQAATDLPDSVQAIKDSGKIIVGTKYDQPGFGLQDPATGDIEGFDAEIGRLLAIKIFGDPSKVEFTEAPSAVREQVIENGTVNAVIATYTINDDRKTKVDFAGPYFTAGQDILVRSDDDSITSVDDLADKNVCTQSGSTSIDNVIAAGVPEENVTALDSYALCADGVTSGTYDAVTTDNVILLGIASQSDGALKLVNNPFSSEPYGIGLPKGDDEYRSFVNDFLEEIYDNGDWERAWDNTVGSFLGDAPAPPAVDRY